MKLNSVLPILSVCLIATAASTCADAVTDWNRAALDAIRARNTAPPLAARNLAILHCAIYDAINGIARTHEAYSVHGNPPAAASREAAGSAAAHKVMSALYPALQDQHDALHAAILAGIRNLPQKRMGLQWGEAVALATLDARNNDGSTNTAPYPGSLEVGQWRPTESFGGIVRPALLPSWGSVAPFALPAGAQFRPPPPPALNTPQYADEFRQVKLLGAIDSAMRTADQTEIALFWGYGPGSATPPGHWNQIALVVSDNKRLSLEENARLFALLNVAMADAGIVSWDCKYVYNYWRPITAIALADTDGNLATEPDANWRPTLPTPPFPEYTSGHSTFSGAAAVVLAVFFGKNEIAFVAGSDDLPGVLRHYPSFSHAAEESGISRIYGGIHFMSANVYGLTTGAEVGALVVERLLKPRGNRSRLKRE